MLSKIWNSFGCFVEALLFLTAAAIIVPPLIAWGVGIRLGVLPADAEKLLGPRSRQTGCRGGRCGVRRAETASPAAQQTLREG